MDNVLTPSKMQKPINLAEDRSPTGERVTLDNHDLSRMQGQAAVMRPRSPVNEISSGILDIDQLEAFGDSLASNALSKPHNLTVDEASYIAREAPLPVPNNPDQSSYLENSSVDSSMGAYFGNKCPSFGEIMGHTVSSDGNSTNMMRSISDVSSMMTYEENVSIDPNSVIVLDDTLDTVPVRQPARIPPSMVTEPIIVLDDDDDYEERRKKSPSKSPTTFSTVRDCSSFRSQPSGESPNNSKGRHLDHSLVFNLNKKKLAKENPKEPQRKEDEEEVQVSNVNDTRQMGVTGTSAASSIAMELDKLHIDVPNVMVTAPTPQPIIVLDDDDDYEERRKKSPSKSPTTLSTVRDCSSFRSQPSGESPNNSKEMLADIVPHAVEGFVGVSCYASISVTSCVDRCLTAILKFDDMRNSADLHIEVSRDPILLSPWKCEKFTFQITANVEIIKTIPFSVILGDSEHRSELRVKFVAPWIQTKSMDGNNLVIFPALHETSTFIKPFIIKTDCPAELLLKLSIAEGDSFFAIKSVQELDRSDEDADKAGKALSRLPSEEQKSMQLCRMTPGKALRVVVAYVAPILKDLDIPDTKATVNGLLQVSIVTNDNLLLLKTIELVGSVGVATLVAHMQGDSLHFNEEPKTITLSNSGTALGQWTLKFVESDNALPFNISSSRFDIPPKGSEDITIFYTGQPDTFVQATLKFKEATTGVSATFEVTGGSKCKQFPIKTNHAVLSWVRHGRKEISLKNNTDRSVHLQCHITGDGFYIDMTDKTDCMVLSFEPHQCKTLAVRFNMDSKMPAVAVLHLVDGAGPARKIKLFGCNSDESVRWSGGIMTYESTALKPAPPRAPVDLELYNKAHIPAFVVATVKFHLQYLTVEGTSHIAGSPKVIPGRARHTITLHIDWNKVDKQRRNSATADTSLATLSIFTGTEFTRRRILKVLKDESKNGEPDFSLLPDYLRVLAGTFEGEDPNLDHLFDDFYETKASLTELMSGLHELTAHIELPRDIDLDNTIVTCDETMVNHRTLAE